MEQEVAPQPGDWIQFLQNSGVDKSWEDAIVKVQEVTETMVCCLVPTAFTSLYHGSTVSHPLHIPYRLIPKEEAAILELKYSFKREDLILTEFDF